MKMITKEQLIELVIGNEFITSPKLKSKYLTLLDKLEKERKQFNCNKCGEQHHYINSEICDKCLLNGIV